MAKVRATRHNGRKGKNGVFRAGHNDRTFDVEQADHIDPDRSYMNVYWDCYQGLNYTDADGNRPERKYSFDQVELAYYAREFGDSIDAQNERHIASRHTERIRSVEEVIKDPKTCPEETIYQLGTKDEHEDYRVLMQVAAEMFEEAEKRYGTNMKILTWALHMDEGTAHIHERHVFFADDGHGFLFPKQEKACEALGFERPDPSKKQSKFNNRKQSFDAELRELFIEIAEKHGVSIEKVPLEGKTHLEKNDYILAKQKEEIASKQAELEELTLKISDIDSIAEEAAEKAYEKACEIVSSTAKTETIMDDIEIVKQYRDECIAPEHAGPEERKTFAGKLLGEVMRKLARDTTALLGKVKKMLTVPEVKKKNQEEIAKVVKVSLRDRLAWGKIEADKQNQARWATEAEQGIKRKNTERGER